MANPIPKIVLHPQFVGTTASADFQGRIARPVSATEYDGDPIPTVADYSRLDGTADSADFQSPIARPVVGDFPHFFAQIATEYDGDTHPNSGRVLTTRW